MQKDEARIMPNARLMQKRGYRGAALALFMALLPQAAPAEEKKTIFAVANFTYSDTSGEAVDQTKAHAERLHRFMAALDADLEKAGTFQVKVLSCPSVPCADTPASGAALLADAQKAGAARLLVGSIQRVSTLITYLKVDVFDVAANKPVFTHLYTFRADTEEAWSKAEEILAEQLKTLN